MLILWGFDKKTKQLSKLYKLSIYLF